MISRVIRIARCAVTAGTFIVSPAIPPVHFPAREYPSSNFLRDEQCLCFPLLPRRGNHFYSPQYALHNPRRLLELSDFFSSRPRVLPPRPQAHSRNVHPPAATPFAECCLAFLPEFLLGIEIAFVLPSTRADRWKWTIKRSTNPPRGIVWEHRR